MPACKQCEANGGLGKVCPHYGPGVHGVLVTLIDAIMGDDGDRHEPTDDGKGGCAVCNAVDTAERELKGITG